MAIPRAGTFDYRVVMTRDTGSPDRWGGEGRSMRDPSEASLCGKRPKFELEDGLLCLQETQSEFSKLTSGNFRKQRDFYLLSSAVGPAPAAVLDQGDQFFFHRFGTGDYALTILRDESLVLALGSCTKLPLGRAIKVDEDERIADLWLYEEAGVFDNIGDPESQVFWIDCDKRDLTAQIEMLARTPQCELVLVKGNQPRNFYDRVRNKVEDQHFSYMTVKSGFTDKDSWISYVKQLPRERPNDLYLQFTTADHQINLCEGEEALVGSYYVRVDRISRKGVPGEHSSVAIARMSAGFSKDIVVKSAEAFLRRCR